MRILKCGYRLISGALPHTPQGTLSLDPAKGASPLWTPIPFSTFCLGDIMRLKTLFSLMLACMFIFPLTIANAAPTILDMPILQTQNREKLIREYSLLHYGKSETTIIPQAVVVHWTVTKDFASTYRYFYNEAMSDGTLNVASHFIVERDGTIYRITPETILNRHAIGYNHCAIGIENIGGIGGKEDLTEEQLEANIELIRYLKHKYPTIKYVFGHYQQDAAISTGLYIEKVKDYYAKKTDPGKKFMRGLRESLTADGLIFFKE